MTCSGGVGDFWVPSATTSSTHKIEGIGSVSYGLDTLCHQFLSIPTSYHIRMEWEGWVISLRILSPSPNPGYKFLFSKLHTYSYPHSSRLDHKRNWFYKDACEFFRLPSKSAALNLRTLNMPPLLFRSHKSYLSPKAMYNLCLIYLGWREISLGEQENSIQEPGKKDKVHQLIHRWGAGEDEGHTTTGHPPAMLPRCHPLRACRASAASYEYCIPFIFQW